MPGRWSGVGWTPWAVRRGGGEGSWQGWCPRHATDRGKKEEGIHVELTNSREQGPCRRIGRGGGMSSAVGVGPVVGVEGWKDGWWDGRGKECVGFGALYQVIVSWEGVVEICVISQP